MSKQFLVAVLLLLPNTALAQDYRPKYEVFGNAGYGATYDDEGGIGRGLDIGAGFGVRAIGKLGFEGSVNRITHLREFAFSGVRFEGTGVGIGNCEIDSSNSKSAIRNSHFEIRNQFEISTTTGAWSEGFSHLLVSLSIMIAVHFSASKADVHT